MLRVDGNAHWTTAIMAMNSKSTAESAEFAEGCVRESSLYTEAELFYLTVYSSTTVLVS